MKLKERANKLKLDIPTIFLSLKDKDTPLLAKILASITIGYALSPIDFIPDFVPVLGYLDDIIILPFFITLTVKLIPHSVLLRNTEKAKDMWKGGKPKKWYYAIPIIIIWFLILGLIINVIFN